MIAFVLLVLTKSELLDIQALKIDNSWLMVVSKESENWTSSVQNNRMSSAESLPKLRTSNRSLINRINKTGPKADP